MEKLALPDKSEILILPLGGCGQFGANATLYGYDGQWILVDCGMAFADERLPGVDILLPDMGLVAGIADKLKGLIVTHAHEDHIGAIAWHWPVMRCPIYATPFTAGVLERKFEEHVYLKGSPKVTQVDASEVVTLGHFKITFVRVAHSIPETRALIIETPLGRIVHTGDWNLDPHPVSGEITDAALLQQAGANGVLAYVGDSTNANVTGRDLSERDVERNLAEVFKTCPRKIAVTMFASNIGRIVSVHRAAMAVGRKVALIGRSLDTMVDVARATGHIPDTMHFLNDRDAENLKDGEVVYLVTGSQGEGRAALARIARSAHPAVKLREGDTVLFSSRTIPGNETAINEIKNLLLHSKVRIVTDHDADIHVSGHPARDEITTMLGWIKPQSVIPVHGERVQQEAHAELARSLGIKNITIPINGALMGVQPDGKVETKRYFDVTMQAIELGEIKPADTMTILERRKISFNGAVFLSVVLDEKTFALLNVQATVPGVIDLNDQNGEKLLADFEDYMAELVEKATKDLRGNQDNLVEHLRVKARRFMDDIFKVKPLTVIHVSYV